MPTPERIFDALTAFQRTSSLKAGIELDIFTAIADGTVTSEQLAAKCQASARGMRTLCDYLTVAGFLTKSGREYGLTPESAAFLNRNSPTFIGSVAFFLASDHLRDQFKDVAAIVRRGGALDTAPELQPEHPMWVEFARSMAPMMMMPANMIADIALKGSTEPIKVLDIAAGHGVFGIMIAKKNPNAHVVAVDWRNVLEVAKENAAKFGVSDRYETIPGSAFDVGLGSGYDLILLTNFLHHFDPPTNVRLLSKLRAALKPGGRVATLDFVPNEDRVSPPFPAMFSMMMLGGTPSGDAYTLPELERMFSEAGFVSTTRQDLLPSPQTLLISSA